MSKNKEPDKFYFVDVHPQPCSLTELQLHLVEFGKTFINSNRLERWKHVTQVKPEKAKDELAKLISESETKYRQTLNGSSAFPNALKKRFGNNLGVYFDGVKDACKVSALEASTLAAESYGDALFSLVPGKLAIFFFHDGDVILFEKR